MSATRHIVLLNQSLKSHILGLNAKEKERLHEKFEFLEAGIWDSGVRVKKLTGFSQKIIFEARLSKGDRMLFTLGKQGPRTVIYVWGLVKHDDVAKAARHIFPENAPFLHFEPQTVEEHPELLLDEIPPEYFSQEAVEEKSPEDYQPQKWLVLSEQDWKRMLLTDDTDRLELFLFLTPEQAEILETPPPVLISGTAGSGKTTLAVYYLLKKAFQGKKKLFLTHNRLLNEFSKKIHRGLVYKTETDLVASAPDFYVFRDLLLELVGLSNPAYAEKKEVDLQRFLSIYRNHRFFQKYDGELVWEEIRSIIKGAKPWIRTDRFKRLLQAYLRDQMPPADLKELKEFLLDLNPFQFLDKIEKTLAAKTSYKRLNDFIKNMPSGGSLPDGHRATLSEIHRIVEKNEKEFFTPLLTYREYLDLGRKRAPNFLYERKDLYDIAEYYQDKLREIEGWDEIDLSRQALRNLDKNRDEKFKYDLVVCDEVQDFTDIQTTLIFHLARSPQAVVLAGDPKQIINPSGFRWEEVKNKYYERGLEPPKVVYLKMNFRCVGNIVKLANALLDLKQRLVGLVGSEFREEWKFNGKPPFLLENQAEEEILERLRLQAADQVILVRDKIEQKKLKAVLGTELVFTIHEAKGLEFDTVFLWKNSSDKKSADLWRSIRNQDALDRGDHPHIRHEINLLYVAITRARQNLIIFDPQAEIWNLSSLSGHIYRTAEKEALSEIWRRTSNPEEWRKQGDYFYERAYYAAAAECYRNAGDSERRETAEAYVLEEKRQFRPAALLFAKHGLPRKAAECREQAGDFREAADLWKELNETDRAALCVIRLYDRNGEHDKAAEEWSKRGDFAKAFECWSRAGNHRKMGEYYFERKQFDQAAEAFEKAGAWGPAGVCFQKVKKTDKAADLYFRAGLWSEAIPLLKKNKRHDKLKECYIHCGEYYQAALLCEKAAETAQAIELFREFQKQGPDRSDRLASEAETFLKRQKYKAAVRYSALGMFDRSAPLHFEQDRIDTALAEFKVLGDHERIAECHFRRNDFYQAALVYESISADDKWKNATNMFELHVNNLGKDREKKEAQLYREADFCFDKNLFEPALARYKALHDTAKIRDTYLRLDRDEEALDYFLNGNRFQDAHRYLEKKNNLNISAAYLNALILNRKGYARYGGRREEDLDFGAKLFLVLLKKRETPELLDLIDRFLSLYYFDLIHKDSIPNYVFDLVLTSRNANAILEILKFASFEKLSRKLLKPFPAALKKRAEESGDPVLLACHLFRTDRSRFEDQLADMIPSQSTYRLFIESRHFRKAVDFLVEKNRFEEAAGACRYHGRFDLAARIFENNGDIAWAARDYRNGKHYEDALRCCRKIGDEAGIARIHERKMEFDQALSIWKKLERPREIRRLSKKLDKMKIKMDDAQKSLF